MSLHLRPAQTHDYDVIASWIEDGRACARWAGPSLAFPFEPGSLAALLAKPDSHSLVLVDAADTVLGFAQFWKRDAQRVHLGRIIIDPAARGSGYGAVLCGRLMQQALAATGLPVLSLRVYRDNPGALHLYQRLGFLPVEADSDAEVLAMECRDKRPGN